jgi:hypothetical protein
MDDLRFTQLEQRLAQVEGALEHARRQVDVLQRSRKAGRVLRLAGICAMAATIGALTMGTASAKTGQQSPAIKAPFTVVTGSTKLMQINTLGQLTLYHAGHPVVVLGPGEDAAGVVQALSPSGDPVAELASLPDGTGQMAVVGAGESVARLAVPSDSNQLSLRFFNGKTLLAGMGATSVDGGLFELYDKKGTKMTKIGNNGYGGTLETYNNDGQVRDLLSNSPSGRGGFDIFNESGTIVATLAAAANGGYFALSSSASGTARVNAGINSHDAGIVSAIGPKSFNFIEGR